MRRTLTADLGDGRQAIVHELRVQDLRWILDVLPDELLKGAALDAAGIVGLLRARLAEIITRLEGCVTLPEGGRVEDLSLSELQSVGLAWWELHRVFFQGAAGALGSA